MKVFFIFFSVLLSSFVFANNMQLQKVSLTDTNRTAKTVNIKMNISWEHSWRDSINWDAAWIIIKYKEPKDSAWKWKHAQLSQSGNDLGTGAAAMKIVVPNDLMGAFFYRSAIGSGNVANDNVKLFWNYGAAGVTNIDSVEVRVFAMEMVYVPQGSYCLGDGDGTNRSDNSFQLKNGPINYAVINNKWSPLITTNDFRNGFSLIGDDAVLFSGGIRISGLEGLDTNDDKAADYPNYPTGYRSFYCMKYKVTQGQYTDFLNTVCANDTTSTVLDNYLNQSNGSNYDPTKLKSVPKQLKGVWKGLSDNLTSTPSSSSRQTIAFDSIQVKFTVSRPDRAYGLMDINKAVSFSEWVGLRPHSELEFEKESRGPLPPVWNEKAWGNDAGIPGTTAVFGLNLIFNGVENGTEYFSNYDITKRYYTTFTGGDGGTGPYRVGIYANDTSSRVSSQASYYGIMDLSKNTCEIVLPISTAQNRLLSYNIHGKGTLSALGNNYSFANAIGSIPTSVYRYFYTSYRGLGSSSYGFRAVRSAPSDN